MVHVSTRSWSGSSARRIVDVTGGPAARCPSEGSLLGASNTANIAIIVGTRSSRLAHAARAWAAHTAIPEGRTSPTGDGDPRGLRTRVAAHSVRTGPPHPPYRPAATLGMRKSS